MDFFSALALQCPNAHLTAEGELDAFAAVDLGGRLDEAVDRGHIHFSVDTSAVTFVDAGGLGALVRLSNVVTPYGGTVEVVAASPRFRQIAELAGLGEAFGLDLLPDLPPPSLGHVVSIGPGGRRSRPRRLSVVPARCGEMPVAWTRSGW